MSFVGSIGGLPSSISGGATNIGTTTGRVRNASYGMHYPSPFFDVAHTWLPTTVKSMFKMCRYFFFTQPLINATVFKLSEYAITDVIVEHESRKVVNLWTEYLHDHLRIRPFQIESGLDYNVYGNSLAAVRYPLQKYLTCTQCGFGDREDRIRKHYIYTGGKFRFTCPKCDHVGPAEVKEFYIKSAGGIKLIRWNPEDIDIEYNDISGQRDYYYNIPDRIKSDIQMGKKNTVGTIPQLFLSAVNKNRSVVFSPEKLYHMHRPTLAGKDCGWGTPLLLPVLKDAYYLQVMKKAQECVAPSTLIETDHGLVPAGVVDVGDTVRTHTGAYRPVTVRRVRPIVGDRGDYAVKITTTGLRQLPSTFSNNHPLWVLRRNDVNRRKDSKEHRRSSYVLRNPSLYEFTWVDAGDVRVGDYVGYPTKRVEEQQAVDVAKYTKLTCTDEYVYSGVSKQTADAFEQLEHGGKVPHDNAGRVAKGLIKKEAISKRMVRHLELDEDLAYIAGWYLGDGSIGARRVDFSMGPDDNGAMLQAAIERVFGTTFSSYPCKNSRGWMLCAFDTILSKFLHGWIPGGAPEKIIPKEVLSSPDNVLAAFLLGYLEADGYSALSIHNKETVSVCCSNKQLTYQLWSLALTLGCISTVSERTSYDTDITKLDGSVQHIEGGRPVFYWTVKSRSARRLSQHLMGQDLEPVVSGKSGFFVHGYFASRVQEVEVEDCQEVISFEVEGDHTFCTPGMATHNSVLLEHILPLRVLFPQAASGSTDPFTTINLSTWQEHIAKEIARWRMDPNYIPILPLPIGQQTLGGDGRALLLTGEMQQWSEQIVAGMGVPREFVFGGMSYSGTNVSMRMVENAFLSYIMHQLMMVRWIVREIATFLDWPLPKIRFKPFKMADDLQRKAFLAQLNEANKLSDTSMLAECDYDQHEENQIMLRETASRLEATKLQQLAMAKIQAEQQVIMSKAQAKSQQVMMEAQQAPIAPGEPGGPETQMAGGAPGSAGTGMVEPGQPAPPAAQMPAGPQQQLPPQGPPQPGQQQPMDEMGSQVGMQGQQQPGMANVDPTQLAQLISQMAPDQQKAAIQNIKTQSPELAQMVEQIIANMRRQQGGEGAVDMRPLPEQRPPRRENSPV